MKIPTKVWLPALCLLFFVLLFPRSTGRSPVTIECVGGTTPPAWSGLWPFSVSRLAFAVTNSSSTPMEVSVYTKWKGAPDWFGRLPPHSEHHFLLNVTYQQPPWTVSLASHRIPGKLEQWLRTYGSKLRLCDITPNSEIKLVQINTNEARLFQVEAK